LFAAYRDERLAGIAAFAGNAEGEVCFLSATTADYCDFISTPADREELIELVMRELRGMGTTEFKLANLPSDSASAPLLRAAARMSGYFIFARAAYFCAQITLKSEEERVQIARSAQRNSKRGRKALAPIGEVAIDHKGTAEKFRAEFPRLAMASVARFLTLGRMSNLVGRERRAFLDELAKLLSAQGTLALSTLEVGGRAIAWHYGFQYAGVWFWYLPVFDPELQHLSPGPGSCLFCEILLQASKDPEIHTVDLGLGDEGYKDRYAKSGRQTLCVTVSRSKARLAQEVCRYQAVRLVARFPGLEARVRRSRSRISSVRTRLAGQGIRGSMGYCFSRVRKAVLDCTEVVFFEWAPQGFLQSGGELQVRPLSINLLAAAAMEYEGEPDTREYLFRSASRLQSVGAEGYALVTVGGIPVHFCWIAPFEGFRMAELGCVLKQPSAHSVLLFDCWTPGSQRGRGHYGRCTSLVAAQVLERGQQPWIFSAATNVRSVHGLEDAGFATRFSLVRKKRWPLDRISALEIKDTGGPRMNLYPAA
jgi:CelD/BcsL family acetyltransferase involved in cellulose biosynthesis